MGPNVQSKIVTTIPQGGVVEVLRAASGSADWVQVKYKDILGYVYFPLLSKEKVEAEKDDKPKIEELGEEFEDEFNKGFQYLIDQKYDEAIMYFQNYINENSASELIGSAYYWLGETYVLIEDYVNAEKVLVEGYSIFLHLFF